MIACGLRSFLTVAGALALAACAIPPRPDRPALRQEAPLTGLGVSDGRAWPDPQWWTHYGDTQLNQLEDLALANAPTLDEAQRRFGAAVSAVDIARAAGGFSAQASAQVQRQRLSEYGLIPPKFLGFNWYNQGDLTLQFQYDFDFWGKNRAAIAAAVDEAHAAEAERATAVLLLTTAVADTYFGWQADEARHALASDAVAALQRSRSLTARRVGSGIEPPDTIPQIDVQLAAARELDVAYAGSARIRLAAIAALLGVAPADLPRFEPHSLPATDGALPASVGLDLISRRADITASRWRVEAAMQRVDQARAQFFPDISMAGLIGLESIDLDKLLNVGSRVPGIGPALTLPVFGRDRLHAAYGVSQAQLETAAAQYDATVVAAARDVATQSLTLAQVDARRSERERQLAATLASEQLAAARVRQGISDDRSLLAAQTLVLQQRDAATTIDAQALSAEIALIKSLGGGYHMPRDSEMDSGSGTAPTPTP